MRITAYKPDIGQEYSNPFKDNNIYPFSKIGRVIVDKDTAEIKRWCGELDSNYDIEGNPINLDMDTEEVMVHIPAFYCKRTWEGEVLTDSILTKVPDSLEYQGYEVHPAFIRADGSIREYILVGAFLGTALNGQLRSIPANIYPKYGLTISANRDYARQGRNLKWNIVTISILSAIQFLYKIGFQHLNSQNEIGIGIQSYGNVGTTMSLGNRSGYISAEGQISLFGIEDMWGNCYQFIDGIVVTNNNTEDNGYYITNDENIFGSIEEYPKITSDTRNIGYIGGISKDSVYNLCSSAVGGSATTGYCDYSTTLVTINKNLFMMGGKGKTESGLFNSITNYNASHSYFTSVARLCYLP